MANYGTFAGNVPFVPGDYLLESSGDNLTATAGGGSATALQLVTQTSRITTVATAGDSVKLPASAPGLELLVINHSLNPMQVFGSGTDQIDDTASTTGVSQMANSFVLYSCATAGNWYTEGLASGFVRGLAMQTVTYATVASNTTVTQAAGTPIVAMLNNMTAGAAGAVTLPVSAPGMDITVHNISGFTITVFPNAGGTGTEKINALANNAGIAMTTNTSCQFTCVVAGQWFTVPRVPS